MRGNQGAWMPIYHLEKLPAGRQNCQIFKSAPLTSQIVSEFKHSVCFRCQDCLRITWIRECKVTLAALIEPFSTVCFPSPPAYFQNKLNNC